MKRNALRNKWKTLLAGVLIGLMMFSLAACGSGASAEADSEGEQTAAAETVSEETTAVTDGLTAEQQERYDFTDRDLDPSYDEATAQVIELGDGDVTITEEGVYILRGTLSDGQVIVDADDQAKVQLVLDGADITNDTSAAIYVKQADKVFVTLAEGSENTLTVTGAYEADGDTNVDAVIFSKDDLVIQGSGSLTINGSTGNGVTSKDDLKVTGGNITVNAGNHGLEGKDSVRIAGGTIDITCGKDGIHSGNEDDATLGFVFVGGGDITIAAGDDGIHADNDLFIAGGAVDVTESYEGLEGLTIDIAGGDVRVTASDDGLNAAGGNDASGGGQDMFAAQEGVYVSISGGTLYVDSQGDGLDSNGDLLISGGTTYVAGPTGDGNGAMDYNGSGTITGGTLVATGSSGMAMNFDSSSTQASLLVSTGGNTSEALTVTDASGSTIVTFDPGKAYSSVLVSSPDMEVGQTYTISCGSVTGDVTLTDIITGSGSGMGGGMGGPGGEQGGPGGPGM